MINDPPKVESGENLAVKANWSHPPSIIYEGCSSETELVICSGFEEAAKFTF